MFSRSIFTNSYLKHESSAHAQLAIACLYISFIHFMTCYQLETYNKETFWEVESLDDTMNMITWLFFETLCGVQLLARNANLNASYKFGILI